MGIVVLADRSEDVFVEYRELDVRYDDRRFHAIKNNQSTPYSFAWPSFHPNAYTDEK